MKLPESWKRIPIKEVYEGLYDGPHATPKPSDEGPIFLGIGNVTEDGHLDYSRVRHISEKEYSKWTKRVTPREDDIVFTYEATLNRYAVIPKDFRGCLGRRMALIRPNNEKVDARFLHYYFFSKDWRATIEANRLAGATVDRVPLTQFPEFPISLPPLAVQRRIASILSAYDDLIENNTRRIEILEEMTRRLHEEWFVHFRFPGYEEVSFKDSELGSIPERWDVASLESFGTILTGKTPTKKKPELFGSEVPFIKLPDMHGQIFITETTEGLSQDGEQSQRKKTVPANSICVSCIGTGGIVVITSEPSQTNQQINTIIPGRSDLREFLYFSALSLRDDINNYGATGATMTNLSRGKFASLKVISPCEEIVSSYSKLTAPMFDRILNLQRANRNLRAQRDLLLPKLVSGEIDVSDISMPDDKEAEAA